MFRRWANGKSAPLEEGKTSKGPIFPIGKKNRQLKKKRARKEEGQKFELGAPTRSFLSVSVMSSQVDADHLNEERGGDTCYKARRVPNALKKSKRHMRTNRKRRNLVSEAHKFKRENIIGNGETPVARGKNDPRCQGPDREEGTVSIQKALQRGEKEGWV